MGKAARPQAPDPVATTARQGALNRQAAIDSAEINQIGQYTPWGGLTYTGEVGSPDRAQHVFLSPELQAQMDAQNRLRAGLLDIAGGGEEGGGLLGRVRGAYGSPFDFGGLPGVTMPGQVDVAARRGAWTPGPAGPAGHLGMFRAAGALPGAIGAPRAGGQIAPWQAGGRIAPQRAIGHRATGGLISDRRAGAALGPQRQIAGRRVGGGVAGPRDFQGIDFGGLPEMDLSLAERARDPSGMVGRREGDLAALRGERGRLGGMYRLADPSSYGRETAGLERATFQRGMNLLAPEMARRRAEMNVDLAQRGLPIGSEADAQARTRLDRAQGDALENLALSSVAAGRAEHGRLADLTARNRAQEWGEAQGLFGAGGQVFGEGMDANRFLEASRDADFRRQLAARAQLANEAIAGAQLGEEGRQFDAGFGLSTANFLEGQRRFDTQDDLARARFYSDDDFRRAGFREGQRQFDTQDDLARAGFYEGQRRFDTQDDLARWRALTGDDLARAQFYEGQRGRDLDDAYRRAGFYEGQRQFDARDALARGQYDMSRAGLAERQRQADLADMLARGQFYEGQRQYDAGYGLDRGRMLEAQRQFDAQDDLARGRFDLGQQQQQFQNEMAWRNRMAEEALLQRQLPYQELAALMGMAPAPGMPQFSPLSQYGIQAPDYAGLAQQRYQADMNAYQQQQGNMWNMLGGLGSAAFSLLSDRRVKEDIVRIGTADNGLPIYRYRYAGDATTRIGFMADEVEKLHPEAVGEILGIKIVDYALATRPAGEAA